MRANRKGGTHFDPMAEYKQSTLIGFPEKTAFASRTLIKFRSNLACPSLNEVRAQSEKGGNRVTQPLSLMLEEPTHKNEVGLTMTSVFSI